MPVRDAKIVLKRDAIDVKGVAKALGAAITGIGSLFAAYAANNPIGGASALGQFFRAYGEVSFEEKPERLAFVLIVGGLVRSLEMTLAQSRIATPLDGEVRKDFTKTMLDDLLEREVAIDATFLESPADFSYLPRFADLVWSKLGAHLFKSEERNLKDGIKRNFTQSLIQTWALKGDAFSTLANALATPFNTAREREIELERYLSYIQREFSDKPLFGQPDNDPVLLSNVFVPLRAFWRREKKKAVEGERGAGRERGQDYENILVDFNSALTEWIQAATSVERSSDTIHLVSGGHGVGKSSSLMALAAEMARSGRWFPVFVPLQRLRESGNLAERIGSYLECHQAAPLAQNPLAEGFQSIVKRRTIVLFLDGLDEIVAPESKDASQATRALVSQARTLISDLNAAVAGVKIVAIVSGRVAAAQGAERELGLANERVLHLLPFSLTKKEKEPFSDESKGKGLDTDQRHDWWERWQACKPLCPKDLPEVFSSHEFEDVSREPLLIYFMALVEAWNIKPDTDKAPRNTIYDRVLRNFFHREKEKNGVRLPERLKDFEGGFEPVLQALAIAARHGGTSRIGSVSEALRYLQDMNAKLKADFESVLNSPDRAFDVSLTFQLRPVNGDETFEFLHKSFAEYLVARRFVASIRQIKLLHDNDMSGAELLARWTRQWGGFSISMEVWSFVIGECGESALFPENERDFVVELFRGGFRSGYPAHTLATGDVVPPSAPTTFSQMTDWARNAEEALLLAVRCSNGPYAEPDAAGLSLLPKGAPATAAGDMFARLLRQRDQGFIAHRCFGGLNLSWAYLNGANLEWADLRAANLRGGGPHKGEPRVGGPQSGEPQGGGPQKGEPRRCGPHKGGPHKGEPRRGEPQGGGPRRGGPRRGELQGGGPHKGEPH